MNAYSGTPDQVAQELLVALADARAIESGPPQQTTAGANEAVIALGFERRPFLPLPQLPRPSVFPTAVSTGSGLNPFAAIERLRQASSKNSGA